MSEAVAWEPAALESLLVLARRDLATARQVMRAAYAFAASGRGDVRKLEGGGDRWRLRAGDWRLLYVREGETLRILEVANRRDAYR